MGPIKRVALPLLLALLYGCATTAGREGDTASTEVTSPAQHMKAVEEEGSPDAPPMSEAEHEALAPVLELMQAAEWQTARELLQEAILTYPGLAEAYANMGMIELQLEEPVKAEQAWLKALELRPGWAAVYNRLGILYRQHGRFDEALAAYQQALAAEPDYANGQRNIAILYELYLGDGEKALQHYRRYRELLGGEGQEVEMWIADLQRRVGEGAQ